MHGDRINKVRNLASLSTTMAICILSMTGSLMPISAENENQSAASQQDSQKSPDNPSLAVCVGKWHGHILNKEAKCELTANIKEKNGQLEGSATCSEKEGTCKHYFYGSWDAENHLFILKDIGLDVIEGASSWYPSSFDKYSLRLVDDKLVGTCHQSENDKTSWITLEKESITAPPVVATQTPSQPGTPRQITYMGESDQNSSPNGKKHSASTNPSDPKTEGTNYMTGVQNAVRSRWHPPADALGRRVSIRFFIHQDGSVSDLKLDSTSGAVDKYVTTIFQAIRACAPFTKPPQMLLSYPRDGDTKRHVNVHLILDSNSENSKP